MPAEKVKGFDTLDLPEAGSGKPGMDEELHSIDALEVDFGGSAVENILEDNYESEPEEFLHTVHKLDAAEEEEFDIAEVGADKLVVLAEIVRVAPAPGVY